jgi:hypothetical protein
MVSRRAYSAYTATVKSIEPDAVMDSAASGFV